jgi:hypothetical protein
MDLLDLVAPPSRRVTGHGEGLGGVLDARDEFGRTVSVIEEEIEGELVKDAAEDVTSEDARRGEGDRPGMPLSPLDHRRLPRRAYGRDRRAIRGR